MILYIVRGTHYEKKTTYICMNERKNIENRLKYKQLQTIKQRIDF